MIEIAPVFLEAVRGRQRVGVVAQMVLAELAGVVAEIEQELGKRRRAGPQIGWAAGNFRQNHANADRLHAGEEGRTPGRAALLGVVGHEDRTFVADAIDVGRLADHQSAVVDARLVEADVVAHDEEDVRLLLLLLLRHGRRAGGAGQRQRHHRRGADQRGAGSRMQALHRRAQDVSNAWRFIRKNTVKHSSLSLM